MGPSPALVTDEGGSLAMVPWQPCHGNGAMATGERRGDVGDAQGDVGGYSWWQKGYRAPQVPSPSLAPRGITETSLRVLVLLIHPGCQRGWEGDGGATELLRNHKERGKRSRDTGGDTLGAPSSSPQARGRTHTHV